MILGLDPSQSTGWALYDPAANLSAMRAGVLRAKGDIYEFKAADLAVQLIQTLKQDKDRAGKPILPVFAAIEMPIRTQPGQKPRKVRFMGEEAPEDDATGSGINAVISSNQMVAACAAILGAYRIPFEMIAPVTWRKQFLGFGTRPGWSRKDWKRAVRERCGQLKITVTNDDMADAVGIAFAGRACQTYRMMQARAAA
jgi:hypothetical protein